MKDQHLFDGLKALAESAFPKRCNSCGHHFETAEQFLLETQRVRANISGLKQSYDDNDASIVEVYRNCSCGSTLMDFFSDRRDISEQGLKRREIFGQLLDELVSKGWEKDLARSELLKFMRGEENTLLESKSLTK